MPDPKTIANEENKGIEIKEEKIELEDRFKKFFENYGVELNEDEDNFRFESPYPSKILDFVKQELLYQRQELEDEFLNQKANDHDQKVIEHYKTSLQNKIMESLPREKGPEDSYGMYKNEFNEGVSLCKEAILSVFKGE